MGLVGVDHHVVGAVHGAQDVSLVLQLHGGEHVVLVVVPVAGGLVQLHVAHAGGHHVLVAQMELLVPDIVLQLTPDGVALGQQHGQAPAHQIVGHKQLQLPADPAVIPALCLLQPLEVGVRLVLFGEGDAVDALERLPVGVAPPVGGVAGQQLDGVALDPAGAVHVGTGAQVGKFPLPVKADGLVLGQVVDQLNLKRLVLHQGKGLFPGQLKALQLQLFLADLPHFGLDLLHVLRGKGKGRQHIVIPALVDGGADGQLHLGPKPFHGLGHDVAAGMPVGFAVLLIFKRVLIVFHVSFHSSLQNGMGNRLFL